MAFQNVPVHGEVRVCGEMAAPPSVVERLRQNEARLDVVNSQLAEALERLAYLQRLLEG